MTPHEAKQIVLRRLGRTPWVLHESVRNLTCFMAFPVFKDSNGNLSCDMTPMLNDSTVVDRLHAMSYQANFVEWAKSPFTNEICPGLEVDFNHAILRRVPVTVRDQDGYVLVPAATVRLPV